MHILQSPGGCPLTSRLDKPSRQLSGPCGGLSNIQISQQGVGGVKRLWVLLKTLGDNVSIIKAEGVANEGQQQQSQKQCSAGYG